MTPAPRPVPRPALCARRTDRVVLGVLLAWTLVTAPLVIAPFSRTFDASETLPGLGVWAVMLAVTLGLAVLLLRWVVRATEDVAAMLRAAGGGFFVGWANAVLCGLVTLAATPGVTLESLFFALIVTAIFGLPFGGGAGLLLGTAYAPLVPALRRGGERIGPGGHDRVLGSAGAWLCVCAGATASIANWIGNSGIALAAAGLAVLGLGLASVAFTNGARRHRWLTRVRRGLVPEYRVDEWARWAHELDTLEALVPVPDTPAVLVRVAVDPTYRTSAHEEPVALVPRPEASFPEVPRLQLKDQAER